MATERKKWENSPPLPPSLPPSPFHTQTRFGLQGGGDLTDYVLFFKTPEAQEAMKGDYQLALGVSGGVAAGPFGRSFAGQYHFRPDAWKMA